MTSTITNIDPSLSSGKRCSDEPYFDIRNLFQHLRIVIVIADSNGYMRNLCHDARDYFVDSAIGVPWRVSDFSLSALGPHSMWRLDFGEVVIAGKKSSENVRK